MRNRGVQSRIFLWVIVIISFSGSLFAQHELKLMQSTLEIPENKETLSSFIGTDQPDRVEGRYYRLVSFSEPLTQEWQDKLNKSGYALLQYVPDLNYILSIEPGSDAGLLEQAGAIHAMPLDASIKAHPDLLAGVFPEWALPDNDRIDLLISFYDDITLGTIDQVLAIHDLTNIPGYNFDNLRTIRVLRSRIKEVAAIPAVSWVAAIGPPDEPENYTAKTLHRSNMIGSTYSTGRKYDGSGVNVMLQDDGIIGPHIDYEGRIALQTMSYDYGDHGDHVAGTIMGAGNLDPTAQGMAPGADVYVYGAAPYYPGFAQMTSHYYSYNIRISSTSYSNGCNAGYTSLAQTMDQQMRDLPAAMHVFSAGNDGYSDCGYGAGAGWGNVTGGHKIGKNVIAVANLDYKDDLSGSSSRGPAHDGRIKPDISGKGSSVTSTVHPNLYDTYSGTSMSCPGVSGTLAQIYQAYRELNGGQDPRGGLMKAVLLNSADDIEFKGPDFKTGWGRINALRAVKTLEDGRYMTDSLVQGDTNSHIIQVPAQVKQLKVMVYWTDPEAFTGASKALINDIDTRVHDALSSMYMPYAPDPSPIPAILNSPAGTGVDDLNNVEQVVIDNPVQGSFELEVIGKLIPQGPQVYHVVYEMLTDSVQLTYPVGGEAFVPNETVVLRWDAFGDQAGFDLEYTNNNGITWNTIATNIPGSRRYFNWTVPNIQSGRMMVKISRGNYSSQSFEPFSIMDIPQNLNIDWACPDSFLLSWDPVPGAESYVVYMLGNKYMDTVGTSLVNEFVYTGIVENQNYWVSVSAIGPNNAFGRRANAIEKQLGIWNCVFPYDVAINVVSPAPGRHPACIDHSAVEVKVELMNVGALPISNISLVYTLGGNAFTGTYNGTIQPGDTAYYTFAAVAALPTTGVVYINASTQHQLDSNQYNDLFTSKVSIVSTPAMTLGTIEDFDAFNQCSVLSDCEGVDCNLSSGWHNEPNNDMDDIDWRALAGVSPSNGTGPIGDHTSFNGNFLYLEASGDCYGREALLVSPCLDLSGINYPVLDFWYNMNGSDMGSLHVDVMHEAEWLLDAIPPIIGDQGQDWHKAVVDLNNWAGGVVAVRFRGYTGDGNLSDLAIDDVALMDATGLEDDPASRIGLNVYPNPAMNTINVNVFFTENSRADIAVLDLSGRDVVPGLELSGSGALLKTIDVSELSAGTYLLRVETKETVAFEKIQLVR